MAIHTTVGLMPSIVPYKACSTADDRTQSWVEIVRGEYLEIPGLLLTRSQVQRLWDLDDTSCDAVLESLLESRFLRRTPSGAFIRLRAEH
jgi:hypothetical protein